MRQKFVLVKLVKSFSLFGVERTVHKGDLLAVCDSIRYINIERGLKSQRFCASTEFVAVAVVLLPTNLIATLLVARIQADSLLQVLLARRRVQAGATAIT